MKSCFRIHYNILFLLLFTKAFLVAGIGWSKQEETPEQKAITLAARDGFMHAITEDDVDGMKTILRTNPLVVNHFTIRESAFILAARYGKMNALRFMTSQEYPGKVTPRQKANAVFYTIEGGHRDATDFLISQRDFDCDDIEGAAREHKKEDGISRFACEDVEKMFGGFAMCEAIEQGDLETVRFFLDKNLNRYSLLIPFMQAVEKGNAAIVKEFLIYGPMKSSIITAFKRAQENRNIELMELFLSKMAAKDIEQFVPHWAQKLSKEQMIQIIKEGVTIQSGFHINRFMQLVHNNDADEIEKTLSDEEISLDIRCKFARFALMTIEVQEETRKTYETLADFIKNSEKLSS